MNLIDLRALRELEIRAEQLNSELFDSLTLKITGQELDDRLIKLTRIKPLPRPYAVQEVFDEAFSSSEVGELYRRNTNDYDVLTYLETKRHKDTIKVETVFRHYFEKELRNKGVVLHTPYDQYAAKLARIVIFGKRSVIKKVYEACFVTGKSFTSNIKLLIKTLHDDFDIPMYVILKHMNALFPEQTTLVKNLSLVAHQNDSEFCGSQAHYDEPKITGEKPIDQERIKKLVTEITTSNTFKHDHVVHVDINSGMMVSTSVAQFIHPVDGAIDDCTLYLVSNTSLYIKL